MSSFFDSEDIVEDNTSSFFDPKDIEQETISEQAPESTPISSLESLARGSAQGLTFGASDELTGALDAVIGNDRLKSNISKYGLGGGLASSALGAIKDIGSDIYDVATTDTIEDKLKERYEKYRDTQQKAQAANVAAQEANPGAYGVGEIGVGMLAPGGAIVKGAKGLSKLAQAAKVGLGTGAAAGLGYSENTVENLPALAGDVALGATTGAVLAPALTKALPALVKNSADAPGLKGILKNTGIAAGGIGTAGTGYELAKDIVNDQDITQESLVGNIESGFTSPLMVAASVPAVIKGASSTSKAIMDMPKIAGYVDSFKRGLIGENISGVDATKKLQKEFNNVAKEVTDDLKKLEDTIGKQRKEISKGSSKVDVQQELDAIYKKIETNPDLPDEDKVGLLDIVRNYKDGALQTVEKNVVDTAKEVQLATKVNKAQEKIEKVAQQNDQRRLKAYKDAQTKVQAAEKKAQDASIKAEINLDKNLNEQAVRDKLLGRSATVETVLPSNNDLLALRKIGEDGTPQIVKGSGPKELPQVPKIEDVIKLPKEMPLPLPIPDQTPIKKIQVSERTGSAPKDAVELLKFKDSLNNQQQKLGQTIVPADDINKVINKTLNEDQQKLFADFNKRYGTTQDMFNRAGIDKTFSVDPNVTKVARSEAEDSLLNLLYSVTDNNPLNDAVASEGSEIATRKATDFIKYLREVNPEQANEIQKKLFELTGKRSAMKRAGGDINSSNPLTALSGGASGIVEKLSNVAGRAVKSTKEEVRSLIPRSQESSKRLAIKNAKAQQRIRDELIRDATPDDLKLADDISKMDSTPDGPAKNARFFKLMQNPMYRNLYNKETEDADTND